MSEPSAETGRTIAITGATGLVGGALCAAFAQRGWAVRGLSRRKPERASAWRWYRCDLPDDVDPGAFERCGTVIHAAYAMAQGDTREARRVNEEGTRRVLGLSRGAGGRFVFISSFSAHEGARSYYGRSKLAMEQALDPARDLIIRPGLVLAPAGGVFGAMAAQIRHRRIIPLIAGGKQPLQTIHIDDLCAGIVGAVERGLAGRLLLAESTPITMRRFLELVAQRLHRSPAFFAVPAWPILCAARVLEGLGLRTPITSENIRGLLALRSADTRSDLAMVNLAPRSAEQSLRDLPL